MDFVKKNITWILIGLILLIALVLFGVSRFLAGDAGQVIVLVDGREQGIYSLREDREIKIETDRGFNLLVIEDGQAYVAEADCVNQVCVHTQPVSSAGGQIICLPHKVVIRLETTEKSETDAVTN